MKIVTKGKRKKYPTAYDVEITWADGVILTDPTTSKILQILNMDNQGNTLGDPVGDCPGFHNHLENADCYCSILGQLYEYDYEVEITFDDGTILYEWPEYEEGDVITGREIEDGDVIISESDLQYRKTA